jgi:hypothetical protein
VLGGFGMGFAHILAGVRLYERRPIDIINLWCKGVVKSMKRTYE